MARNLQPGQSVISYMKSQISRYGIPDELISDNGPQFACEEFAQFMKDYDIKHTTSSPYHPQANGQAERTVQTVKRLLVNAKDPYKALLDYRNSPLDTGFSPAQLFLGRTAENNVTDNIQTPATRTWQFQGASR